VDIALARPLPRAGRILPEIDTLRAVAILAVFVQHLGDTFRPFVEQRIGWACPPWMAVWLVSTLRHAFWGVDLFFVLSGFSLALGYLHAFEGGMTPPSPGSFLLRRGARIFPAFWVALAVAIATRRGIVHAPGFGAALAAHLALLHGYTSPGGIVFIGALWSLTTEAHFYAVMPWLARPLLGAPRGLVAGLGLCAAVWLVRAALHALVLEPGMATPWLESTQRHWIVSRLDQFVLGMLAARAATGPWRDRLRAARRWLVVLSLGLLVVAFRLDGAFYLLPGGSWPYALTSIATASLVLGVTAGGGAPTSLFRAGPARALGIISYGVFLFHQLALEAALALVRPGPPSWIRLACVGSLAFALSTMAGTASWILVERPVMRVVAERFRRLPALRLSGAADA
jgi:peptidoglycan/LPS O-acetylase OafA/YrhL